MSWVELHEATPELESYDKALCTTWNISYTHIKEQSSTASLLLRQWAYFDSKDLWYELLQDGGSYKPDWLRDLTRDKLTFYKIMGLLCSHGLVQADPLTTVQPAESVGYSVHACVHSWTIHVLNRDSDKDMAYAALDCVGSHVVGQKQPEFWSKQRRLLGHADRCYDMIKIMHMDDEEPRLLHSFGFLYANQGRLSEAEALYKRAIQGFEKARGPEHTSTLDTVNNLGILYSNQGRLDKAEAMYKRALQGYEKARGPEHTSTLNTVNNLGILYKNQGRLSEAEALYKRALQGYEKARGLDHTSTLQTVSNLGILYSNQGRLSEAEAICKRVLQGHEKALGPHAIKTYIPALNCLEAFGNLCYKQGKLQNARQYYLRAQHGLRAVLGADCQRVRRLSEILEEIRP